MSNYMERLKTTLIDTKNTSKSRVPLELKQRILKKHFSAWKNHYDSLNYNGLVHLVTNDEGEVVIDHDNCALCFTSTELVSFIKQAYPKDQLTSLSFKSTVDDSKYRLKPYMLGEVFRKLTSTEHITSLKINPIWVVEDKVESYFMCEEVLFAPLFDNYTQKSLMSDPRDAKALLALNIEDQRRYGVEFVFQTISDSDFLKNATAENSADDNFEKKIDELKYQIARTVIPQGSASIYFVLLRMENYREELSFIRDYKTFDPKIKVLFVTSRFEILTGNLEKVPYYTGDIDEIMMNLLSWYNES